MIAARQSSAANSSTIETAAAPVSLPDSIWLADEDRGDLGVGQAAGEDQDRAELAERAGEGQGDAGREAGQEIGEDDPAEDR